MTKEQEIQRIRSLINSLGPDSYIGPWLQSVIKSVENDIKGDIFPTITPGECMKICDKKLEAADRVCKRKIEDAEKEAKNIKARAISSIRGLMRGIAVNLDNAKQEVEARVYRLDEEEEMLKQ